MNITALSASALSKAIHSRQVSCRDVMQAFLVRIAAHNPLHNAIVSLRDEAVLLREADARDAELERGATATGPIGWMHGMPQAIKDLALTQGLRSTQGSPLLRDFVQTVLKAVLVGWVVGSTLGFLVGVAIDRLPFLQRGLLPIASLTGTIPLVAVAPIMVMWFGFEWPSKAAVVVLMTFFPMLVATLAGLRAAGKLELELMHSYAAGYVRTLIDLRLPCALPFIMSALKVNATLALIGGIVAEFFGSPTVGLGFRISTEAARLNMPFVWGAIVVAAVSGSAAYALLVQLERRWAFWHPSVRSA